MKKLMQAGLLSSALVAGTVWAGNQYRDAFDLTGTWRIAATIPSGTPVCPGPNDCVYPALTTATSDGSVLQTAPISNTLTGHGSWKRVGPHRFRAHTVYFRVDPVTGTFVGTSETTIEVTIARGGQTLDGSFSATILDTNGAPVTDYSGTVTAERIQVE